jgi:CheY-like chemotaxis protein
LSKIINSPNLRPIKILVIDDEPLIRRAFQKLFQGDKYEVFLAEDGLVGHELWERVRPDCVFLDVIMPGLNGWEVLEKKDDFSGAKVQMMSAYTGDLHDKKRWIEKIDGFLQKPFEDIMKIKSWVDGLR